MAVPLNRQGSQCSRAIWVGMCPLPLWMPLRRLSDYCGPRPSVSRSVSGHSVPSWPLIAPLPLPLERCLALPYLGPSPPHALTPSPLHPFTPSPPHPLTPFTPSLGFENDGQTLAEGTGETQAQIRFLPPVAQFTEGGRSAEMPWHQAHCQGQAESSALN